MAISKRLMKKKRLREVAIQVQPRSAAGQAPDEDRRQVLLQIAVAGLSIFFLIAGLVMWGLRPRSLTESERAALRDYEKIRLALADDDLNNAVRFAGMLRANFPQLSISKPAAALEKCDSLESARENFKEMSQEALTLVRGVDGYFIAECPPEEDKCPVKCSPCRMAEFGKWAQISAEVKNPFMGKSSPKCGILRPTR